MPKGLCSLSKHDTEETLLKFVDGDESGQTRSSLSESSQYECPDTCSLFSGSRTEFSERSGSPVPLKPPPLPPLKVQSLCSPFAQVLQNRSQTGKSAPSECSNSCSLLSNSRTKCSERSGSTVLRQPPPPLPLRTQTLDDSVTQGLQDRPLPQPPIASSSRHQHTSRTPSSSSSGSPRHRRTSRTPPFLQRRCLIIIIIISLTSSVVTCGLTAMCFVYKFVPVQEENTFTEGNYETCVPCVQLRHGEGQASALKSLLVTKNSLNNVEICCARNSGQMSALIQIIMNQQKNVTVTHTPAKHKFRSSHVSAHMYMHPGIATEMKNGDPLCEKKHCHIKLGKGVDPKREHTRHVKLRNNTLSVEVSGLYFVYSSINMKAREDMSCSQLPNKTFRHFIIRTRLHDPNMSGILSESSHTCSSNGVIDRHTGYAAGVFELKEKDQISLEVSGSALTLFDGNGTYLGLVLLSNMNQTTSEMTLS